MELTLPSIETVLEKLPANASAVPIFLKALAGDTYNSHQSVSLTHTGCCYCQAQALTLAAADTITSAYSVGPSL